MTTSPLSSRYGAGFFLLAGALTALTTAADGQEASKPIRVLFVGNSQIYFNDLPKIVETLAESAPKNRPRIRTGRAVYGGATLESHWKKGTEKDTARTKIAGEKWDFVVIQDYTFITTKENYNTHARLFHDLIRQNGAQTVLLSTASFPKQVPKSFLDVHDRHIALGKELKVPVAAAGKAWLAYWGDNPTQEQILELYHKDKGHPGPKGSYLYACTLYPIFTGHSPVGLTHRIPGQPENTITPADAKRYQEAAWQVHQEINGKPAATDDRSPRQVAEQLAVVYGTKLDQVAYIPALPLVAKLRLSELTREPKYAEEVDRIVAPFLRGEKSPSPKSGSEQAGHLIFAELALRAKGKERERWIVLCRSAADQIFSKDGKPLPLMPYHSEMSDAVFMAGPILAATGKLTGERKYFDAADTHFASMRKLCLRRDGIYRHSPLCEAAWGRGNGFPALGLALSDWPDDHPARKELVAEFQKHMAALKPHQDAKTGCWHQVIDHPESYDEFSCTCMIGFAMQRGIRRGWLAKDDYQPSVDRAWRAIKERTSADGKLVDVSAGTGKQKTLEDYFKRPAINGRDDRGGAMGMLFATELLAAE